MYVCMYVCMKYVCIYACIFVHACMFVCMYVHMLMMKRIDMLMMLRSVLPKSCSTLYMKQDKQYEMSIEINGEKKSDSSKIPFAIRDIFQ